MTFYINRRKYLITSSTLISEILYFIWQLHLTNVFFLQFFFFLLSHLLKNSQTMTLTLVIQLSIL